MGKKLTQEQFLINARAVHGDEYDYANSIYNGAMIDIEIYHPKCGTTFTMRPNNHISGRNGCWKCAREIQAMKLRSNTREFVEKAKRRHINDMYNYDEVDYKDNNTRVKIRCNKHGFFMQRPDDHLAGKGCSDCAMEKRIAKLRLTREEFLERAMRDHGDSYIYDDVDYVDYRTPVNIRCKEHGSFLQKPMHHIRGHGCPHCYNKSEGKVREFLDKHFHGLFIHDEPWPDVLGNRRPDFRSDRLLLVIEFDGRQHFEDVPEWDTAYTNKLIDTWKSIKTIRASYYIVRIPHDLLKRYDWEDVLLPIIKKYEKPRILYINSKGNRLYDEHKISIHEV